MTCDCDSVPTLDRQFLQGVFHTWILNALHTKPTSQIEMVVHWLANGGALRSNGFGDFVRKRDLESERNDARTRRKEQNWSVARAFGILAMLSCLRLV